MSEAIIAVCCVRSCAPEEISAAIREPSTRETFRDYGIRMLKANREAASVGSMVY